MKKFIKQPNAIPHIFVASSSEYLLFSIALRKSLGSEKRIIKPWTEGIFEASATTIESLALVMESFDFGIVILSPDDTVTSRNCEKLAPRDNVIFELGLMMGAFGRTRTFIIKPQKLNIKIPSDLLGITCLEFDNTLTADPISALREACIFLDNKILELGPK